jgi:hypothetical protein
MKKLSKESRESLDRSFQQVETEVDKTVFEMVEDGEEVKVDCQKGSTVYRSLSREGDEITIISDYVDTDGQVYKDQEESYGDMPLEDKLMIFEMILRKSS